MSATRPTFSYYQSRPTREHGFCMHRIKKYTAQFEINTKVKHERGRGHANADRRFCWRDWSYTFILFRLIIVQQTKPKAAWDLEIYYQVIGRLRLRHRSRAARNADFSALFLACFFLIIFMHLSLKTIQAGKHHFWAFCLSHQKQSERSSASVANCQTRSIHCQKWWWLSIKNSTPIARAQCQPLTHFQR